MKQGGLILLIIGVGLCAAFGARLTPGVYEEQKLKGTAQFAGLVEHEQYCEKLLASNEKELGPKTDGCVGADAFQGWDGKEAFCKTSLEALQKDKNPKLFRAGPCLKSGPFQAPDVCGDTDAARKNNCSKELYCKDALTKTEPLPAVCYGSDNFKRSDKYEPHCAKQRKEGAPLYTLCKKSDAYAEQCVGDAAKSAQCAPNYDELLQEGKQEITSLRDTQTALEAKFAKKDFIPLRKSWIDAKEKAVEPAAKSATLAPVKPGARLSEWFNLAGIPFLLGLVLIVAGGWISRIAVKKEANSDEKNEDGEGPIDFGECLNALLNELEQLADEMGATSSPSADEKLKAKERIEALQRDRFELLVDARGRLQIRHGLAAFAAIFSPLSGAERRLNRTWSALVDNHWPEAVASVNGSLELLRLADEEMKRIIAS